MPLSPKREYCQLILILTNSKDATADVVCERLPLDSFLRLNTDEAVAVASIHFDQQIFRLTIAGREFTTDQIGLIWYRRPERIKVDGVTGEGENNFLVAEWSAAIEGFLYQVPRERWLNYPPSEHLASLKLRQLLIAKGIGFQIPESLITCDPDEAKEFVRRHDNYAVVKPISSGEVKRQDQPDSLLYTTRLSGLDTETLLNEVECPTFFQEEIEKEYDVRVTVFDQSITAVKLIKKVEPDDRFADIRIDNMSAVRYEQCDVPYHIRRKILILMQSMELRFGALDFLVTTTGEWVFLEINPNGQWAWLDYEAGTNIAGVFAELVSQNESKPPTWPIQRFLDKLHNVRRSFGDRFLYFSLRLYAFEVTLDQVKRRSYSERQRGIHGILENGVVNQYEAVHLDKDVKLLETVLDQMKVQLKFETDRGQSTLDKLKIILTIASLCLAVMTATVSRFSVSSVWLVNLVFVLASLAFLCCILMILMCIEVGNTTLPKIEGYEAESHEEMLRILSQAYEASTLANAGKNEFLVDIFTVSRFFLFSALVFTFIGIALLAVTSPSGSKPESQLGVKSATGHSQVLQSR